MLGRRNIRDSIGYVTLGLFSHALLDELSEVKRRPEAPPTRRRMIDIATESLNAITSPDRVDRSHWKNLVFQNYQEARTLRGALGAQEQMGDIDGLRTTLIHITNSAATTEERIENTDKAMRFFADLARMATTNAERPEERVPPGVRRLVSGHSSR